MPKTMNTWLVALSISVVSLGGLTTGAAPASAAVSSLHKSTSPQGEVVHRVVWDTAPKRASNVVAANLDGTGQVTLYASDKRQVGNLAISHDGGRVAFDTYSRNRKPAQLMVAPTTGGPAVNVLRKGPRIEGIGPVGWSPNDKRLVFSGSLNRKSKGSYYPSYLFTIRTDGTGLRRLRQIGDGTDSGPLFGNTAWTPDGIYYVEDYNIRRLHKGKSTLVFKGGFEMYPTGDGTAIYFRASKNRPNGVKQALYRSPTHSPRKELVVKLPNPELGFLPGFYPNQDGTRLIGVLSGRRVEVEESTVMELPAVTAIYNPVGPRNIQELPFIGTPLSIAWY